MSGVPVVGVLFVLVSLTHALPDLDTQFLDTRLPQQVDPSDFTSDADIAQEVNKRDLEFNQYVPSYRLRGEPSCDQLRAMWRLSKREARRATSTNNIPRSRPYSYGRLLAFAPNPHRPYVYGETRHFATNGMMGPVKGSFNRLRGMMGMGAGRPGSFQRLRGIVSSQRLPGESSKGKYDELRDMVVESHRKSKPDGEESPGNPSLRSDMYQPVRRASSSQILPSSSYYPEGFIGAILPGSGDWRTHKWTTRDRSCEDMRFAQCQSDLDCTCAGQFRCSRNRCKVLSMHSGMREGDGSWHSDLLREPRLSV